MPNRYEREIEEILRNLEQTEPGGRRGPRSAGDRRSGRGRRWRFALPRPHFSGLEIELSPAQWFLALGIVAALIGGGFAYAQQSPTLFTGVMAIVSTLCLIAVLLIPSLGRPRYSAQRGPYSRMRPVQRNPFSRLATRWHLFLLKRRYRRRRDL
jgi:hypothetical protein